MADLRVTYAGVEFKNPLVLASATPGWDGEGMKRAGLAGIGGVIPKTIGPVQDWAAHPCNGRLQLIRHGGKPIGMVNLELFTTKTREAWIKEDLAIAKEGGAVMQVSVLAMPHPEETAQLVEEIQATGMADLLELNVSCPMPASTVGMHIGKSAERTYQQAKAAKSAAKIPLTVKLTPNVSDMVEIAQAVKEAGADGVTISNSVRSFAGVDIETGMPLLRGYGGYTGPAIKPIIMRHLSEVARNVDIPISAVGGVMSFKEIVEYIMLGATTVQTCTAVMWNGYQIIPKLLKDLENWLDAKGYKSLDEIRGIALPHITTVEELAKLPAKYANIEAEKCTNCGICERVCMYRAISAGDTAHYVTQANCDGCGLCAQWCPSGAIELREASECLKTAN
ncbi:4Fe-4S dicluster domain-containing protein [Zhaonella formicivorans]|uniref:4Fe-4S dicluster domain-containing protein n=1 Tax=Zhaonella formicivorans TaxID=2528593 RepID=UPI0010EFF93D|nr:4Fe-4S dicluster domain-containing protein [Zhaonella formicivorans]